MIFQIALTLFALLMIVRTYRQYHRHIVTRQWAMLWTLIWFLVIGVAIWPKTTDFLAAQVGVGRGADLLVYLAILFLLFAQFRLFVRTQRLHEQQTELVRRIAIERAASPHDHAT